MKSSILFCEKVHWVTEPTVIFIVDCTVIYYGLMTTGLYFCASDRDISWNRHSTFYNHGRPQRLKIIECCLDENWNWGILDWVLKYPQSPWTYMQNCVSFFCGRRVDSTDWSREDTRTQRSCSCSSEQCCQTDDPSPKDIWQYLQILLVVVSSEGATSIKWVEAKNQLCLTF